MCIVCHSNVQVTLAGDGSMALTPDALQSIGDIGSLRRLELKVLPFFPGQLQPLTKLVQLHSCRVRLSEHAHWNLVKSMQLNEPSPLSQADVNALLSLTQLTHLQLDFSEKWKAVSAASEHVKVPSVLLGAWCTSGAWN